MPKNRLSHSEVWGSNPEDFTKKTQSRNVFHLGAVKIVIIHLKWDAQD
jgi:hypothetical protein